MKICISNGHGVVVSMHDFNAGVPRFNSRPFIFLLFSVYLYELLLRQKFRQPFLDSSWSKILKYMASMQNPECKTFYYVNWTSGSCVSNCTHANILIYPRRFKMTYSFSLQFFIFSFMKYLSSKLVACLHWMIEWQSAKISASIYSIL